MRRKKDEATGTSGARLTPKDIQDVEFRLAFRGYNERDVDAFLDRLTEDLAAYLEELEQLRAAAATTTTAVDVAGVRAEAEREAERIVAEARAEADRILAEARARAAALGGSGGDVRAVVAPFLNREREFLQRLGSLVQSHAEEIKAMVLALRSQAEASGGPATAPRSGPATVPPSEPATTPASATAGTEPSGGPTAEEAFAPITLPEAERERSEEAAEQERPAPAPAPAELRRDSGERSLRELFWGED